MEFTPIAEVGEFGLIEKLRRTADTPAPDTLVKGIGDDAAVYRIGGGKVHIVTTDALVENVHFDRVFTPMPHLGFKAISVNVSDIVAMNGRPLYVTVALGLPSNVSVEQTEALYLGMRQACERFGCTLVGGDVTAAAHLTLSVTVVGEAAEDAVVYRSGAKPGDLICVTGEVGGAYAGLKVLLDEKKAFIEQGDAFEPHLGEVEEVVQRQLYPVARLDVVQRWAEQNIRPRALIDVSDGVAGEVHHLCERSNCGAMLHGPALPLSLQTRAVAERFGEDVDTYGLFGGEDYELLFTIPEAHAERFVTDDVTVIGKMTEPEEGIHVELGDGSSVVLDAGGYRHF